MKRRRLSYLIGLARSMGKPLFEVEMWPESELLLQMAYDLSQNEEFKAECEYQEILALSPEERLRRDMAALAK